LDGSASALAAAILEDVTFADNTAKAVDASEGGALSIVLGYVANTSASVVVNATRCHFTNNLAQGV